MPKAPVRAQSATSQPARQYQAMKNRLFVAVFFLQFAFLLIFLFTGLSRELKMLALGLHQNSFFVNAVYFGCFSLFAFVVFLPFDFYAGHVLERRFHLARQGVVAWFKDHLKKCGLTFFVCLILVEAVYFFLAVFPQTWWLWAAGVWFFVSVVLTRLTPKVILPLFFGSRPLEEGPLRSAIFALFARYGVRLQEVLVLDFSKKTVKANAMVAGLGATKQIFLSDTLLEEFAPEEIEAVLAHEMGHYLRRDTFKLVGFSLLSSLVSFFVAAIALESLLPILRFRAVSDIAALPLLLGILMLTGLFLLPFQNGFCRLLEKEADRFALEVTANPVAFVSMMRRLGRKNLAEFAPSKIVEIFLYDHPPLSQRVAMAQNWRPSV